MRVMKQVMTDGAGRCRRTAIHRFISVMVLAGGLMGAGVSGASAYDEKHLEPVTDEMTRAECGACHIPYAPGLLPADSWKAVVDDLSNHFGEDASLKPEKVDHIRAYLVAHANPHHMMVGAPVRKITEQGWWVREHRYDVSEDTWKEVGTKANCVACHKNAANGNFEN